MDGRKYKLPGPAVRIEAGRPSVLHMFWSCSALSLFVDFQINQVPSHSEAESHIFLFHEQIYGRFTLAARHVNVFN